MRKVLVLVCVLALLASAAILVGCGSGSSSQTPEGMAQTFWTAIVKGDFVTPWNLMSADSQKGDTETAFASLLKTLMTTEVPSGSGTKVTHGKATINGNKGTITVTLNGPGITNTLHMPIIKENGVWKVDGTTR